MNDRLFVDLDLPLPDINLEVGSGTHAVQTAEVMRRFEPVLDAHRPSCVAGRRRRQLDARLHARRGEEGRAGRARRGGTAQLRPLDAGRDQPGAHRPDRRSPLHDRARRRTTTSPARASTPSRAHFVGNVMIDSLLANRALAVPPAGNAAARRRRPVGVRRRARGYGVVTLHRPSNVDHADALGPLLDVLRDVSERCRSCSRCIRARAPTSSASAWAELVSGARIAVLPPQGYLEMLGLMSDATLVLTDSGGMQEETTALGVPCLTLRENTERPITIEQGTNTLVGRDRGAIERARRRDPGGPGQAGARAGALGRTRRRAHRRASRRLARPPPRAGADVTDLDDARADRPCCRAWRCAMP